VRNDTATYIILITPFILNSCSAVQLLPLEEALLEQPSAENHLILESAVGDLLNSQPIKLADNVFLEKSTVIIEHHQPRNNRGTLLDGREMRQADTVSLLTKNGKCYVKHHQSENIKFVNNVSCRGSRN
jgi:hypothetical protein